MRYASSNDAQVASLQTDDISVQDVRDIICSINSEQAEQ